jgi:hypothetical protein
VNVDITPRRSRDPRRRGARHLGGSQTRYRPDAAVRNDRPTAAGALPRHVERHGAGGHGRQGSEEPLTVVERRQRTAGDGAAATGMDAPEDRSGDGYPSGDGGRICARRVVAAQRAGGSPRVWPPKPANTEGVSADSQPISGALRPGRASSASACEPYREVIKEAAGRGRNTMAMTWSTTTISARCTPA